RGRGGRQGDPGSSRFYSSLQDDLLRMFMGEWTINVFKKIGMEYGEAIESRMLTRGIEKAQKKVEERNFLARKNLLDYDEVIDRQRLTFYGMRQQVLEGSHIDQVIWDMIGRAIEDAVEKYVTQDFVAANIAEWARTNFGVAIDGAELKGVRRFIDVEDYIKNQAKLEVETTISQTLGEYLGESPEDPTQWDVKSLAKMASTDYHTRLNESQIRKMDVAELEDVLKQGALEHIDAQDSTGIMPYLERNFAADALCRWAEEKFGIRVEPDEILADKERQLFKPAAMIIQLIDARARESYRRREIEYPVDHMLGMVGSAEVAQIDNPYAADYLRNWARGKFNIDVSLEQIQQTPIRQLRDELIGHQERFLREGQIEKDVDAIMSAGTNLAEVANRFNERFGQKITAKDIDPLTAETRKGIKEAEDSGTISLNTRDLVLRRARAILRDELTRLEQYVLISIFDQAWKDHLYAMDVLKGGIGLQSFGERDPRIIYKREGYKFFETMLEGVRDKVTDLIFRVRVEGKEVTTRSAYNVRSTEHQVSDNYGVGDNVRETASAVADGSEAPAPAEAPVAVKTIVRDTPKVGRNDPCPCGSGKKYKNCHGAEA
ncbi:MAG: SEC-C domain-containing protein, partial [Burkholderiales bacterium]|nr:SEC-C domain-containing protein [Phycisphaerae bacterium]